MEILENRYINGSEEKGRLIYVKYGFSQLLVFIVILLIACSSSDNNGNGGAQCSFNLSIEINESESIRSEVAFPLLTFDFPIDFQNANDCSNRIFVAEHKGIIKVFPNSKDVFDAKVFLDITDRVLNFGELGLVALTFHPDYKNNGYFYVHYVTGTTSDIRTRISRFSVSVDDPDRADPNSELILLEISEPEERHKGGSIAFGPDGYLYIAKGDGGVILPDDLPRTGQNLTDLFGKILRIDVDNPDPDRNYGIPVDNPFYADTEGFREEIYAYGFRNPFRMSFDSLTGQLWVGDVGTTIREEIDIIEKGKNYGWSIMEGSLCLESNCNTSGLTLPVFEYDRDVGHTIIGGYVYRGKRHPFLEGGYIYGDWFVGKAWVLRYEDGQVSNSELVNLGRPQSIISFGVDEIGDIYICTLDGFIYRMVGQ